MTRYAVRWNKNDRRWQLYHVHQYPNYTFQHVIYSGDLNACWWFATGDPLYELNIVETVHIRCGLT